MSSNRLIYDTCAYKKELDQSVSPLSYVLNPIKYENCQKCRMELGIVGGTAVSHIKGNLVDLENDLRGQTRIASLCPDKLYHPTTNNIIHTEGNGCNSGRTIDTNLVHLPSCQMIKYKPVALPPPMKMQSCPSPSLKSEPVKCNAYNDY